MRYTSNQVTQSIIIAAILVCILLTIGLFSGIVHWRALPSGDPTGLPNPVEDSRVAEESELGESPEASPDDAPQKPGESPVQEPIGVIIDD